MPPWRAVFFDLFDTLVTFDRTLLPLVTVGDRTHPSTAELLFAAVSPHHPHLERGRFHRALTTLLASLREEREADHREISSDTRFLRLLAALSEESPPGEGGEPVHGVPLPSPPSIPPLSTLAHSLTDLHMGALTGAVVLPPHHRKVLETLERRVPLALVSNFDCARHGRNLLQRLDLNRHFREVVISDEVGWRKPHPQLFLAPAKALGLEPQEVLFVGDTPESDVAGALAVGMGAAWFNPRSKAYPAALPTPTLELRNLEELPNLVSLR